MIAHLHKGTILPIHKLRKALMRISFNPTKYNILIDEAYNSHPSANPKWQAFHQRIKKKAAVLQPWKCQKVGSAPSDFNRIRAKDLSTSLG